MNNTKMLDTFTRDNSVIETGKIVWKENNKIVASFKLNKKQKKMLDMFCGEADRREAFALMPYDVVVNKMGDNISFYIEERKLDG